MKRNKDSASGSIPRGDRSLRAHSSGHRTYLVSVQLRGHMRYAAQWTPTRQPEPQVILCNRACVGQYLEIDRRMYETYFQRGIQFGRDGAVVRDGTRVLNFSGDRPFIDCVDYFHGVRILHTTWGPYGMPTAEMTGATMCNDCVHYFHDESDGDSVLACEMAAWKKRRGLHKKICEIRRYCKQFLTRPRLLLDIHYGGSGGDDKTRVTRSINGEQVGLYPACHPERHILRQISDELDVSI